jgi:hypothetical protein
MGNQGRIVATGMVFRSKIWMVAGRSNTDTFYDDVWSSSDGISWTASTVNAEFGKRCRNTLLSFDEKMWLIGGDALSGLKNEVWNSSDGGTWTEVTNSANFSARSSHASAVFNNKMWVSGGYNGTNYLSDVWNSTDGSTWTKTSS